MVFGFIKMNKRFKIIAFSGVEFEKIDKRWNSPLGNMFLHIDDFNVETGVKTCFEGNIAVRKKTMLALIPFVVIAKVISVFHVIKNRIHGTRLKIENENVE
jgi:hypothetical protein